MMPSLPPLMQRIRHSSFFRRMYRLRQCSTLAIESCSTPSDFRGSISPCCSLSGVPPHDAHSYFMVISMSILFSVFLYPSPSNHSPKHHITLHSPFLSRHMSRYLKAACVTFDSSRRFGLIFSSTHTIVFLAIHHCVASRYFPLLQSRCSYVRQTLNQQPTTCFMTEMPTLERSAAYRMLQAWRTVQ